MNSISWQGLQKVGWDGTAGVGFWASTHFCVNKITGFDVRGFGIGIWCDPRYQEGTIDTNWWWLSYVRDNHVNIQVDQSSVAPSPGGIGRVNAQRWDVNVDSRIPASTSIITGGWFEYCECQYGNAATC
jgi:hypothetical protein